MRCRTASDARTAIVAAAFLRRRCLRWGATDAEVSLALPGDELVPRPDMTATRGVTIRATADTVWPWIAQLGQGRGGFYSYDFLENLLGCDIHSADRIVPEYQRVEIGAQVKLAPEVALTVALVEPQCSRRGASRKQPSYLPVLRDRPA